MKGLTIRAMMRRIHAWSKSKGWWEGERNFPEQISLMHSELSEALEEFREHELRAENIPQRFSLIRVSKPGFLYYKGRAPNSRKTHLYSVAQIGDKLLKPEGIAAEFADTIIRILDTCAAYKIPIEQALLDKMAYNDTRPYRHGGKAC